MRPQDHVWTGRLVAAPVLHRQVAKGRFTRVDKETVQLWTVSEARRIEHEDDDFFDVRVYQSR